MSFDHSRAYRPQEQEEKGEKYFNDGREIGLLHFVYSHPNIADIRGSPQKVLAAIDEYARTKKYLMNVGDDKGPIVCDLIEDCKPQIMVELGGYVGYSAILFGDRMRRAGGHKYFSLEKSPEFAAVIMALVDLAGLDDVVKVVVGSSAESIKRLHANGVLQRIDLLFLDHVKPLYTSDLKLCEHLKLVGPGTVLAADNVIKPGNPPYLEYVRSSVEQKRKVFNESTANGIGERRDQAHASEEGLQSTELHGNPNLIYESRLVEGFEPSGVPDAIEISKCLREER